MSKPKVLIPVIKYGVVTNADKEKFCESVKAWLSDGWHFQGGVSMASDGRGGRIFAQAMTKEVLEEET